LPSIVPVYAAILGLIFFVLSLRVIRFRHRSRIGLGSGGDPLLERRIRVHANFAEYVPIALILLTFVEMQGTPTWLLHILCAAFLLGRMVHAYGVSQHHENYRLRVSAMATTFTVILTASLALLAGAVMRLS
jgi:uncharacterized protein